MFNYCRHYTQDNIPFEHFLKIVLSIRYTNLVDFNLIIPEIQKTYNLTNRFELDPFDTLYNHSETAEEESLDSDADLSELNLDILFQTLPPSPVINLVNNPMATIQNVFDYLTDNDKGGMLLRIEPFRGDGTQDPLTWLDDFNRAAQANKWNLARKKDILAAFLRDNAEEWTATVTNYNNLATGWNAVTAAFRATFCTQ